MDRPPDRPPRDTVARSPYAETLADTHVAVAPTGPRQPARVLERRYTWREQLGEGGMGEVRLYHDAELGRDVAMKVMRVEHLARPDLRARFLVEARVQGRIEHPSIVPVYDLQVSGGATFFTMKRVHGLTLSAILSALRAGDREIQARFSRHKLLAAFARVCLTVDFAHAQGVVHRDLKPDNIMLGAYGEVYVLDWGVAKITHATNPDALGALSDTPGRTAAGTLFGTLGYMAPEQIDAPSGNAIDARTDVYALGAILFEVLALVPLHAVGPAPHMLASTRGGVDARPSVRAPAAGVPPELDSICVKATARDRQDRFASARALHDALARFRERDRDLELRRALAEEHATRAKVAATGAETELDPRAPLRTLALQEASRALAFDPRHGAAFDVLRELLANPPHVMPPEVVAELARSTQRLFVQNAKIGGLLLLTYFAYLPVGFLLGFRDPWLYLLVSALCLGAATDALLRSRKPPPDGRTPWVGVVLTASAIASFSLIWGPFVLVPPIAVAFAATQSMVRRTRAWPVEPVVTGCAIVLVPAFLASAGVIPPFFAFEGGRMLILPRMLALPANLTLATMAVTHVILFASIGAWFMHLRATLDRAKVGLYHQAWQLRHLVGRPSSGEPSSIPPAGDHPAADGAKARLVAEPDARGVTAFAGRGGLVLDAPLEPGDDGYARYVPRAEVFEDRRIGRVVAMRTAGASEDADDRESFLERARIQARLEHPSIPPIYDAGRNPSGHPYVTMRRVGGTTLAEVLAGGGKVQPSLHNLLEAFEAACMAVDYAHANGVAHRTLGANRILLGDYGEVYVTGWASGAAVDADGKLVRADVAALGAILSAILAAPSQPEAADHERHSSAGGPVGYAVPELEAICARALASGGEGGTASAAVLHDAVLRYRDGERDVVRRQARADEHARAGRLAADRVFAGDDAGGTDRASAMREVSQALALDPSNARATGVLMRLFTVPARRLPAEAEEELVEAARDEQRRGARIGSLLYLSFLLYVPVLLLQGLLSPLLAVIVSFLYVATAITLWRLARSRPGTREPIAPVVLAMLAASAAGTAAGPLMLAPTAVMGNLIGFLLQVRRSRRVLVLVVGCLAFVGPLLLQWAGLLPPSYASDGGALAVIPRLVALPPTTPLILMTLHVMVVVSVGIFVSRFRDTFNRAEATVQMNNWQLRQLVPREARAAVSIAPAGDGT